MSRIPLMIADDDMYLDIWQDTYAALQTHTSTGDGFIVSMTQVWCAAFI